MSIGADIHETTIVTRYVDVTQKGEDASCLEIEQVASHRLR